MRAVRLVLALALSLGGFAALAPSAYADDGTIVFVVTDLRNANGRVRCGLFQRADNWLGEQPWRSAQASIRNGQARCVFRNVPAGTYALTAMHDENDDGEMNTTLVGIPEEGYAMSRDAQHGELGAPSWEEAVFEYRGGRSQLTATMRYRRD